MIAQQTLSEIFRKFDTEAPEGWCVGALVLAAQRHLRGSSSGRLTASEWREVVTYVGFHTAEAPSGSLPASKIRW